MVLFTGVEQDFSLQNVLHLQSAAQSGCPTAIVGDSELPTHQQGFKVESCRSFPLAELKSCRHCQCGRARLDFGVHADPNRQPLGKLGCTQNGGTSATRSYALSTKAGCECVAHALQAISDFNPEATVVSRDQGVRPHFQKSHAVRTGRS